MIALVFALSIGTFTPPAEAEAKPIYAAIWNDLRLNAMIGNGNWVASLWANAGDSKVPDHHIRDLTCRSSWLGGFRCRFELFRDGGPAVAFDQVAPDRLACEARFERDPDDPNGWQIKHLPPLPTGGHSRTTMICLGQPK